MEEFYTSGGIKYNLFDPNTEPPGGKNFDWFWCWWKPPAKRKWLQSPNDVFSNNTLKKKIENISNTDCSLS
jgi:hypothetical protein